MHNENLVVDERSQRQVTVNLIDQLEQSIGIVAIFLMNFSGETVAMIHHRVLMIASVEHNTAGKDDEAHEKNQQNFETLLAAINEIAVEDVAVGVRW